MHSDEQQDVQPLGRPVAELFNLRGQVALVTGGSRGLGLEIARALGEAGAQVVISARRREWLEAAATALAGRGVECVPIPADVSQQEAASALVGETVQRLGRLDVLVNAAGIAWAAPTLEMSLERWRAVMDVNATGTFLLCQAAGRHMLPQRRGKIVNIASVNGLVGIPESILPAVAYAASKGAIIALTRDLAVKWAPYGVCVNAIAPYFFPTRMTQGVIAKHEQEIIADVPMGRLGGPDDVAGLALFLASPAADYVSGQVIAVDGAFTAR